MRYTQLHVELLNDLFCQQLMHKIKKLGERNNFNTHVTDLQEVVSATLLIVTVLVGLESLPKMTVAVRSGGVLTSDAALNIISQYGGLPTPS